MKSSQWKAGAVMLGLAVGMSGRALHAQPGGDAKGQNPPNQQQAGGGRGGNRPPMTPEQRQQMMQQMQQRMTQMREQMVRGLLTNSGFADKALQDAVIDFWNEQDRSSTPVQEKARKVSESLRDNAVTDEQLSTLLADWRAAAQSEKARRVEALKGLDAEIGYTKKPRLDALLSFLGIVGDESSLMGGMSSMGGLLSFGMMNGFGGPGGGPGGFGGPRGFGRPGGPGGGPGGPGGGPGGRRGPGGGGNAQ